GMANVEVLLPLALRLMDEGDLSLDQLLTALTYGPAACFGLEAGSLAVGSFADFVIFDSTDRWLWDHSTRKSKGLNSGFTGEQMTGRVVQTFISGQRVYTLS
ncbi:MAG: amidohydrolase family protein, partial [Marinomonas gallaica]